MVTAAGGRTLAAAEGFARWVQLTHDGQTAGPAPLPRRQRRQRDDGQPFRRRRLQERRLERDGVQRPALLTATANDVAFEEVFALPLRRLGRAGDLLITISSSGNSPNILRALETARSMSIQIVTLTGMCADNRARALGDLNFYVPSRRYGWVECAHQLVLHYWLDQYLNLHADGAI